jgi:hypothetical protein
MRKVSTVLTALFILPIAAQEAFHCGTDEFHRVGASIAHEADFPQRVAVATAELEDFTVRSTKWRCAVEVEAT